MNQGTNRTILATLGLVLVLHGTAWANPTRGDDSTELAPSWADWRSRGPALRPRPTERP